LVLAATIAHCTYDEAKAEYKRDKNWKPRKLAKVGNFGFPGGLGISTFLLFAKGKPYNLSMEEREAKELKRYWLATWPEMSDYFARVSELCSAPDGAPEIVHPVSERIRGRVRYTAACNGYFQGLLADAAGTAGWLIADACYADPFSPLYGCRPVNFVHDEFILEIPDDERASDAVKELCRLMRDGANQWLPDVPFKEGEIAPVLMSHWSKDAKTLYDETGRVLVWTGEV
jgi:hypothetical protein